MFFQASTRRPFSECAQKSTTDILALNGAGAALSSLLVELSDRLFDHLEQARTRQVLLSMSDRALDDIGLSRADVDAASRKDA